MSTVEIDESKVEQFIGQVAVESGAALSALLVYAGDRLGLYRALGDAGPVTSDQLAERTGTHERMVREWLANQAAAGYLIYDPEAGTFELPPEHSIALTTQESPASVMGVFQLIVAAYRDADKVVEAIRTGEGLGWGDHHCELFQAADRSTRPDYQNYLVSEWVPALDGVVEKLNSGAKVADVGCGFGASTVIMAKAYPRSEFVGFDNHHVSVERARKLAAEHGVADRVRLELADSTEFTDNAFDLVCFLNALHDMGDPLGTARHARSALAPGGTVMLVELVAGDRLEDNLTPVGRLAYALSTIICTPSALAQGGAALGAQAGEARLQALFKEAGFTNFRRAAETPFNVIYEARP